MYILIFDDGLVKCARNLTDAEFSASDDGYLSIIRVDEPGTVPKEYYNDEWHELEVIA